MPELFDFKEENDQDEDEDKFEPLIREDSEFEKDLDEFLADPKYPENRINNELMKTNRNMHLDVISEGETDHAN